VPPERGLNPLWISVFLFIPFVLNLFNTRRFGEIEYWLTIVKVTTITALIVLGILLPMGGTSKPPLLGNIGTEPMACSNSTVDCLERPGFNCTFFSLSSLTNRLERISFQGGYSRGTSRSSCRVLGVLLRSRLFLPRLRDHFSRRRRN